MSASSIARARVALSRGDVLIAYDEATAALSTEPEDLEARFIAALALARAGAVERAQQAANDLIDRIAQAPAMEPHLREDAEALAARIAKSRALNTDGPERELLLRHAAELYERVAVRYGRYYSCINAATLYLLAGDERRAHAIARRARGQAQEGSGDGSTDEYWARATLAEAALILGEVDVAAAAVAAAASLGGTDFAAMAVTRRQLRLVCEANALSGALLEDLSPPAVLHYCGHRSGHIGDSTGFPKLLQELVAPQIRDYLDSRRIGFGYGSLASGADILTAEALLATGVELHVVLPFSVDEFVDTSVAPAGDRWVDRFRCCYEQASSITVTCDSGYRGDDGLFGYAARIAMGHALNRAAFLDTAVEQLAVWDQQISLGEPAGTAHDIAVWSATGHSTHVIPLPSSAKTIHTQPTARDPFARDIRAIFFADFRGFSRLRDEHFPVFVNVVFSTLGAVLDAHGDAVLWRNSWGDAIAAVCVDVATAASCALALQDALAGIDLPSAGLPRDLGLRIGAHAGPVMAIPDPVRHEVAYWGRELTRAARIEPRTPEGEVYVTDAFAALLAVEPRTSFATEYVGRVTTAKEFETIPMYQLLRRPHVEPAASAVDASTTE